MLSRLILHILRTIVLSAGAATAAAATQIHGAGATFPAPLYARWAAAYARESGVDVHYDAVGSGAGIDLMRGRLADFGATDAPLAPDELKASGLAQFPVVIGGVVPVVNISGIKPGDIKLSGPVLADIYLGRIRQWNDKAITELNPGLDLPEVNITVVHRSDASGSSMLWTNYLAHASSAWRGRIGASLLPAWPFGIGSAGNDGVASYVQRTRFAIGYVEYAYARSHRLSDISLRNHDGNFVQARRETFRAAVQAAGWNGPSTAQQLSPDQPGRSSWPITGASFILVSTAPTSIAKTQGVMGFFDWALHHGESMARDLEYEPIPPALADQLSKQWQREISDNKGKPTW